MATSDPGPCGQRGSVLARANEQKRDVPEEWECSWLSAFGPLADAACSIGRLPALADKSREDLNGKEHKETRQRLLADASAISQPEDAAGAPQRLAPCIQKWAEATSQAVACFQRDGEQTMAFDSFHRCAHEIIRTIWLRERTTRQRRRTFRHASNCGRMRGASAVFSFQAQRLHTGWPKTSHSLFFDLLMQTTVAPLPDGEQTARSRLHWWMPNTWLQVSNGASAWSARPCLTRVGRRKRARALMGTSSKRPVLKTDELASGPQGSEQCRSTDATLLCITAGSITIIALRASTVKQEHQRPWALSRKIPEVSGTRGTVEKCMTCFRLAGTWLSTLCTEEQPLPPAHSWHPCMRDCNNFCIMSGGFS